MFWTKACPRCGGDLLNREDVYGSYVSCAQCGHVLSDGEEAYLRQLAQTGGGPPGHPLTGGASGATEHAAENGDREATAASA